MNRNELYAAAVIGGIVLYAVIALWFLARLRHAQSARFAADPLAYLFGALCWGITFPILWIEIASGNKPPADTELPNAVAMRSPPIEIGRCVHCGIRIQVPVRVPAVERICRTCWPGHASPHRGGDAA